MGVFIIVYNRISDEKIIIYSNIYEFDYVVVVDEILIGSVDVIKGFKKDGVIIVNILKFFEEVKKMFGSFDGKVYIIDVRKILMECLGKYFLNIFVFGVVIKVIGIIFEEEVIKDMEGLFKYKFVIKLDVIEGNFKVFVRGM